MRFVSYSILTALLQAGLLLGVAQVIGPREYVKFSLCVAASTFASSVVYEWMRLVLARNSGSSRTRARQWLLNALLRSSNLTSITLATVMSLAVVGLLLIDRRDLAVAVVAGTLLTISNGIVDCVAMFFRYTRSGSDYNRFAISRTIISGSAMLLVAWLSRDGFASAIALAISGLAFGLGIRARVWRHSNLPVRWRQLGKLALVGLAGSLSSISSNLGLTVARATIGLSLPPPASGSALLSFDLGTRGLLILGQALNTWLGRPVLDASHVSRGNATKAYQRTAALFGLAWAVLVPYGLLAAIYIPLTLHSHERGPAEAMLIWANLAAACFLAIRLYCADLDLYAQDRVREVATASLILAAVCVAWLLVAAAMPSNAAPYGFPFAVAVSMCIYMARNRQTLSPLVGVATATLMGKLALALTMALHPPREIGGGALLGFAFMVALDLISVLSARRTIGKMRRA